MKKHIVALKSLKEPSLTRAKDLYVFVFIAVYINLAEKRGVLTTILHGFT